MKSCELYKSHRYSAKKKFSSTAILFCIHEMIILWFFILTINDADFPFNKSTECMKNGGSEKKSFFTLAGCSSLLKKNYKLFLFVQHDSFHISFSLFPLLIELRYFPVVAIVLVLVFFRFVSHFGFEITIEISSTKNKAQKSFHSI
jgi:hypothetical protein